MQLFSQMVMGFNGKNNLDIDRLTSMLEENRTLLNDMATKECSDGATLPKLLFELVEQSSVAANKQQQQGSKPLSPGEAAAVQARIDVEQQSDASASESDEDINEEGIAQKPKDTSARTTTTTTTTETTLTTEELQQNQAAASSLPSSTTLQVPNSNAADDEDEVDAARTLSQAANNNEKLIVSATTIRGTTSTTKKHRKISNANRKSTATGSGNNTNTTTLKLCDIDVKNKVTSAQEIIGNLPKVWRVLMELLNHHKIDPVQFEENGKGEDCYKSVETPNGPKAELSVSKTYLKLKVSAAAV